MKILIIDDIATHIIPLLEEKGYVVDYCPLITKEEVYQKVGDYDGLILRSKMRLDSDFFSIPLRLKWIARAGSGIDNIDEKQCKESKITLLSAGEGNCNAVAEHTIGMMLSIINNMPRAHHEVKNWVWHREENRGIELKSCNVGLIGYGKVGKLVAKKLSAMGCDIFFYDPVYSTIEKRSQEKLVAQYSTIEDIQKNCQIISLHTSLNESSYKLINSNFFSKCIHPIYIINAARGQVLEIEDLLDALKKKQVSAVALDVLENEKFSTLNDIDKKMYKKLLNHSNVFVTPHIAGWTKESYKRISQVLYEKIVVIT